MESIKDVITVDSETLGGQPVFKGTRVPVESLFDHLKMGVSLNEFLDDFPTVSREQAVKVLEIAGRLVSKPLRNPAYVSSKEELKERIEVGLRQIEQGNTVAHEDVIAYISKLKQGR